MREKLLIGNIKRKLPPWLHHQSMTDAARTCNGTPDHYYDGPGGDLWVEFKQLRSMPRSRIVVGDYTPQQLRWLIRRFNNGKNAVGIVGLPNRTACIQVGEQELREGTHVSTARTYKEVQEWICAFVLCAK